MNFIMSEPSDDRVKLGRVPEWITNTLAPFCTICVPGCCEWGAYDLSTDQVGRSAPTREARQALAEQVRSMLAYARELPPEANFNVDNWCWEREETVEVLEDFLRAITAVDSSADADPSGDGTPSVA